MSDGQGRGPLGGPVDVSTETGPSSPEWVDSCRRSPHHDPRGLVFTVVGDWTDRSAEVGALEVVSTRTGDPPGVTSDLLTPTRVTGKVKVEHIFFFFF